MSLKMTKADNTSSNQRDSPACDSHRCRWRECEANCWNTSGSSYAGQRIPEPLSSSVVLNREVGWIDSDCHADAGVGQHSAVDQALDGGPGHAEPARDFADADERGQGGYTDRPTGAVVVMLRDVTE